MVIVVSTTASFIVIAFVFVASFIVAVAIASFIAVEDSSSSVASLVVLAFALVDQVGL